MPALTALLQGSEQIANEDEASQIPLPQQGTILVCNWVKFY